MVSLPRIDQLALIVHDMLNDGLKPGGGNPAAAAAVADPETHRIITNYARILEAARKRGLPVFCTGHALRPDYKDAALGGGSPAGGYHLAGTWGVETIDELKPNPEDWIIHKGGGYSAFTGTALDKWLRRLGVTTIIIGGGSTHTGVQNTVRAAVDHDYDVIVASDACKGSPDHHEKALMVMATFTQVVTTAELVDALLQAPD